MKTSTLLNHAKLGFAIAMGLVVYFELPHQWVVLTRGLVGWNVAVLLLLPLTFVHLGRFSSQQLERRYREEDPSAPVILLLVVAAAFVSIAGIVAFLPMLKTVAAAQKVAHVLLAALTIADSWLLVPTMFCVHYADMFYSADAGHRPLKFPNTPDPVFWDFAYFSFTIAAACQTADVSTMQVGMRRIVAVHSVIAFLFNVAILGFAVNVSAGLLS